MGGGLTAMMAPSSITAKRSFTLLATSAADSPLPRSDQSLSVGNAMPAFWPVPEKLKPMMVKASPMASSDIRCCSTSATTLSVRVWVAPGGSCTSTMT
ncbi:hypothetical protein D3C85_1046060 [compost metagenome]